jgi:hypothetical protein
MISDDTDARVYVGRRLRQERGFTYEELATNPLMTVPWMGMGNLNPPPPG